MEQFRLPAPAFDLEETMTCGQTFSWHRLEGELYGEGGEKFYTFREKKPLIVEQEGAELRVETSLPEEEVRGALGLDADLEEIFSEFPEDALLEKAREELWGLRLVQDEFFPTLAAYLLSPQMRIPRIKKMYDSIAREYGETREVNGHELLRFPTREELSRTTEEELRGLGTGYRAAYIVETVGQLEEFPEPGELQEMKYKEAKEHLKTLHGVGDKVADCVLLFSLDFREAYPLDTWATQVIEKHYPELHGDSYSETVENLRERYGENAGYAQEYLFHAARQNIIEV